MEKFSLAVETSEIDPTTRLRRILTIEPPFTLELDVVRNILSSANFGTVRVKSLNEANRTRLRKNVYDDDINRQLILRAGYEKNLPIVFAGTVKQAWSWRESGATEFTTQLDCFDGGFAFLNGITSQNFPAGTNTQDLYINLLRNLPGVTPGYIGEFDGKLLRGNVYNGTTAEILAELTGGAFFIDKQKAHILKDNEYIPGQVLKINAASGLLGTPLREDNIVYLDMVFEPMAQVGQLAEIESTESSTFAGTYKIISVKHRGVISESISGQLVTSVGLFYPSQPVPGVQIG